MSQFPWEGFQALFLEPALAPRQNICATAEMRSKDSGPLLSKWHPHFTRRGLSRSKSWSSQLASSSREPSSHEQAGARVIRALVFLTCHRRTTLHSTSGGWVEENPITLDHFLPIELLLHKLGKAGVGNKKNEWPALPRKIVWPILRAEGRGEGPG